MLLAENKKLILYRLIQSIILEMHTYVQFTYLKRWLCRKITLKHVCFILAYSQAEQTKRQVRT